MRKTFVLFLMGLSIVMFSGRLIVASGENKVWFEVGNGYWCGTDGDIVTNVPYERSRQWLFQIVNLEDETGQPLLRPTLTVVTDRQFVSFGPFDPVVFDGRYEWHFDLELPESYKLPVNAAEPDHIDHYRPGFSAERSVSPEILAEQVTVQNLSLTFKLENPLPDEVDSIEIFIGVPNIFFQRERYVDFRIISLNDVEGWSSVGNGWTSNPSDVLIDRVYRFEATLEAVKSPNLVGIFTVKPGILVLFSHHEDLEIIGKGSSATIVHPHGPEVTVSADGEYEWYGGVSFSRQDFWFTQIVGPMASFSYSPSVLHAGEELIFNASDTYDPDGDIVSYEWDFGDDNVTAVSQNIIQHTYAEAGNYSVTLTARDASGSESEHSIVITVIPSELIREPRSVLVVAAVETAVIAATAALSIFSGLSRSFNATVSKLPIPDQLREFLQFYGEEIFQTVDEAELEALEKEPFMTRGELVSLGISTLITTLVFGFVEANGLPNFLKPSVLVAVIPATLFSVCLVNITGDLSEALGARTCKVYRQFELWMYGLAAFLFSGLIFLSPFSSPGITRYQSGEISSRTMGLIVLSKMLMLLTLMTPFAALAMLGLNIIGDAGLLLTLMTVCYSLVPLNPLVGKAVFDYRKEFSLAALVSTGLLFYGCTFKLLPPFIYIAAGLVSLVLSAITLYHLRKTYLVNTVA